MQETRWLSRSVTIDGQDDLQREGFNRIAQAHAVAALLERCVESEQGIDESLTENAARAIQALLERAVLPMLELEAVVAKAGVKV